ncbi:hypothetical protein EI94DRAFT_1573709, partial [Lactarius quietus]
MSLKEDKEMVEGWKEDANIILIFSGLFSASVAAALGPTWPGVNVNPQPDGNENVQILTRASPPGTDTAKFEQNFQLVNSFWLSSLVLSLTCALLAISLQQWARQYLMAIRQRRTPHRQARIREYLAQGVRDSGIAILVDLMRAGQQLSFALFALGLL